MDALMTRSLEQRRDALHKGNAIRTYRAQKKKAVKAGTEPADFFLAHGPHDPRLRSMRLREALMCMPTVGAKKADRILQRAMISPSKTLSGLSAGQWERLYVVLESYPSIRKRLRGEER
jgi:hypothetical protein